MSEQLKSQVREYYQLRDQAYEQQERYTKLAFNSGASEEDRYKSLRNECSQKMSAYDAKIQEVEQQLLSMGIYTQVRNGSVTFGRR